MRVRDAASHPLVLPLAQETVDSLTKQLEAFQAQMRRAEESVSSRNYKQHLQVPEAPRGDRAGAGSTSRMGDARGWAIGPLAFA